jgi:hypothetical protein
MRNEQKKNQKTIHKGSRVSTTSAALRLDICLFLSRNDEMKKEEKK